MPSNRMSTFISHLQNKQILTNIVNKAKQYAPTTRIATALEMEDWKQVGEGTIVGKVLVRLKNAPEARAYEFGSGIHSQKVTTSPRQLGAKGKIVITPKNTQYLAFPWEAAHAGFPRLPDGRVVIKRWWRPEDKAVRHPGVEARPYLSRATIEQLPDIRAKVAVAAKEAIIDDVKITISGIISRES